MSRRRHWNDDMTDWGIPGRTLQVNDQLFACLSGIYHLFIDNRVVNPW